MKPVSRVQYLLTSSACTYVSVKGSNSAVGTAVRKLYGRRRCDIQLHTSHTYNKAESSPGENWELKVLLRPSNETFQVRLANPSNRIDVRYRRPRYTIGTKNQRENLKLT